MATERPENEPLTQAEMATMSREIHDLRLRAEHGLLRRLVTMMERQSLSPAETAEAMQALAALSPRR